MLLLLFLAVLIGGVVHILLGHFADGGLLLGFAAFLGTILYYAGRETRERKEFLEWLKVKRPEIEKGWAFYKGQKITTQTMTTQYQACISLIIRTLRFRSRFLISGRDNFVTCFAYTLVTFLLGWWGIPFGVIFTPQAIYRNLRGGYKRTIGELLPKLDEELEAFDPKRKLKALKSLFQS